MDSAPDPVLSEHLENVQDSSSHEPVSSSDNPVLLGSPVEIDNAPPSPDSPTHNEISDPNPVRSRPQRTSRLPKYLEDYILDTYPASMDKWVPYGQNQGIMPKLDPCGSHIGILALVGPTWGPYRSYLFSHV